MTGRRAALAGSLAGSCLLSVSPAASPAWLDLLVCATSGVMTAWAVLRLSDFKTRHRGRQDRR